MRTKFRTILKFIKKNEPIYTWNDLGDKVVKGYKPYYVIDSIDTYGKEKRLLTKEEQEASTSATFKRLIDKCETHRKLILESLLLTKINFVKGNYFDLRSSGYGSGPARESDLNSEMARFDGHRTVTRTENGCKVISLIGKPLTKSVPDGVDPRSASFQNFTIVVDYDSIPSLIKTLRNVIGE